MTELVKQETEVQTVLSGIMRAAADSNVDVAKLKALLDMQREIFSYQAEIAFNDAMNACQSEIKPVARKAENNHTKSKYAKLEAVDDAVRDIYAKHGFSLSFGSEPVEGGVRVTCLVAHKLGHSRSYQLQGELDVNGAQGKANKTSIQGLGSTISYLRRYLTLMIFNIVLTDEDNDAQPQKTITDVQQEAIKKALGPFEESWLKDRNLASLSAILSENFDRALTHAKRFATEQSTKEK